MRNSRFFTLKRSLVILFTVLYSLNLVSLYAEDTTKPVIALVEDRFDFGQVSEGNKVEHEFTVQNKGSADLQIQRVVAGCGCTATTILNSAISPNSETKIQVSLDTQGLYGDLNKTVRVYSNDPENPLVSLALSGKVSRKVNVEPANIIFEKIIRAEDGNISRNVKVSTDKSGSIKIGDISSFSKYITIENIKGDDTTKEFTVSLNKNLPLGDFRERIIISLEGSSRSSVNLPVYANVKGFIEVIPPSVSFGIISGSDKIKRKVTVRNNSDKLFKLSSVKTENKAITAKINQVLEGKQYDIDITLDPQKVDRDLRAEINLEAETELDEQVVINAYGVLPPKL